MSNSEKNIYIDKIQINYYPGHMAKAKREIKEKLNLIDIVFEVIDSRIPLSSRINIDDIVPNKPRILIFTKYDLCDKSITDKFVKEFEKEYPVVKVNLKENNNIQKEIINQCESIINSINIKRNNKGMNNRSYRAIVVGAPNVGKSTLINRIAGRNVAKTGNLPGVTRSISWIKLNRNIELLDTPGILYPNMTNQDIAYNLASISSIKEEIVNKEDLAIFILNKLYISYPNLLKERYGIEEINDIEKTFEIIGRKRGCLMKGNIVDFEKVYTTIINDLKEGKIGKITLDKNY